MVVGRGSVFSVVLVLLLGVLLIALALAVQQGVTPRVDTDYSGKIIPTYVILSDEMNVGMTGNSSGPGSIEWIYNSANVTEYTGQGTIKAAQSAGRPYLLLFWSAWIGISVEEVDVFSRVADKYYQDYTFIKLNIDDYWQDEVAYNVRAIPAIHFYSKDGVKKGEDIGNVKFPIIESDIKRYLQ